MSDTIVLMLELQIKQGEERQAEKDMVAVLQAISPESGITHTFYGDPHKALTVNAIETHPSSQSLLDHMARVAPLIAKSRETADLISMRVFGNASPLLANVLLAMDQAAIPEWIPGEGHPAT